MEVLQLWLPTLGPSIGKPEVARDVQRAFRAWQGEVRVWLLPSLDRSLRWQEEGTAVLAIPAEHLEVVDVFHVGENGYVWGIGAQQRFPGGRVDGLLQAWLNALKDGLVTYAQPPMALELEVPRLSGEAIVYESRKVLPPPGPMMPGTGVNPESGKFTLRWPPDGLPLPTISPAAESFGLYGPLTRVDAEGAPTAVSPRVPDKHALCAVLRWAGPLAGVLPIGGTADELHALTQMIRLAHQSWDAPDAAWRQALELSARYLDRGQTPELAAWVYPTLAERGEVAVLGQLYDRYGLWGESLDEVLSTEEARQVLLRLIPCQRAWGAVGLFWALLRQAIEARRLPRCGRCGRSLVGAQQKRFCDRQDDPECYRQRIRDYACQKQEIAHKRGHRARRSPSQ